MRSKIKRARELMRTLRNLAANARGYVYAGTAALARMWKCSERTVYRWLDELERVGEIAIKIVGRLRRIYLLGSGAQLAFNFDAECQSECQSSCQPKCQSSIPATPHVHQELPPISEPYCRDLRDWRDSQEQTSSSSVQVWGKQNDDDESLLGVVGRWMQRYTQLQGTDLGEPDREIVLRVIRGMNGASLDELDRMFTRLHKIGAAPERSYGWFVRVVEREFSERGREKPPPRAVVVAGPGPRMTIDEEETPTWSGVYGSGGWLKKLAVEAKAMDERMLLHAQLFGTH